MTAAKSRFSATVIVCAYMMDRFEQSTACVESLLGQDLPPDEVIVIVDHNPELEHALRASLPAQVAIFPSRGPRGLSGARNEGIGHARAEIVAFLDDDAVAEPGWLAALVGPFDDRDVLVTGGWTAPIWEGRHPGWFPDEFGWVVGYSYRGMIGRGPVRNVFGGNMAVRADVFCDVGGFDPAVGRLGSRPLGGEEAELCIRARRHRPSGRVEMVDDALIRHHVPRSRQRRRYFLSRCYHEGISKARVRRMSGPLALGTEARYATRVLPGGFFRNCAEVLRLRHPVDALQRAALICAGLVATAAGYATGELRLRLWPPPATLAPAIVYDHEPSPCAKESGV